MANAEEAADSSGKPARGKLLELGLSGLGIFLLVTLSNVVTTLVLPVRVQAPQTAEDKAEEQMLKTPIYHDLNPPLIANINGEETDFVQVSIDIMARDQAVIDAVDMHKAAIRNSLLLMFAALTDEDIVTRDAKENLRRQVLEEIQSVLSPYLDEGMNVEEVYFTSFVTQ